MYSVYILRWPRTHLTYVGMTENPKRGLKQHRKSKDYGIPYMEILASSLTLEEAEQLEAYYIEAFNSHDGIGGEGFNKSRMYDQWSRVKKSRFIT